MKSRNVLDMIRGEGLIGRRSWYLVKEKMLILKYSNRDFINCLVVCVKIMPMGKYCIRIKLVWKLSSTIL